MSETVLVIGSGSREHTIAWKLLQSPKVKKVFVAPGNGGTQAFDDRIENLALNVSDNDLVLKWCRNNHPTLVVVGPEDPLNRGIANTLRQHGIPTFGPNKEAAQIECSKAFSKDFMTKYNIPTAKYQTFNRSDEAKQYVRSNPTALVIKASGLAAGKGVIVATDVEDACKNIDLMLDSKTFGAAGETIVIEELLIGDEVSVLAFTDGTNVALMPPACDHKRAYENDEGPNTGGMGAFCPSPFVDESDLKQIRDVVIQPAVDGLRKENSPFVGTLYAGLMMTASGPKVIEFNCRFGDPETQAILPLMDSDLYDTCLACAQGNLLNALPRWKNKVACGVVIASGGYPASATKNQLIEGLDDVTRNGLLIFHGGTAYKDNKFFTAGGRVLSVVSVENNLIEAAKNALHGASLVKIEKSFYRSDIAKKAIDRLQKGSLDYKASGVDIDAGNELVSRIKGFARATNRSGVIDQLGGFGALFDLKATGYTDPILVSGTDGVGTKLKIALETKKFDSVGIDLVAMCVNDILVQGAEPLFFLDYFACSKLDVDVAAQVVAGIADGCKISNCALVGGETAEMPGMYMKDDFDLAGFAVGAVNRDSLLPRVKDIGEGDVIIGLPSSGVHSNGFSLVRKVFELRNVKFSDAAPFEQDKSFGELLLTPTRIYVKSLLPIIKQGCIKALSHITGGGLLENIPRILPKDYAVDMDASKWPIPRIFQWIQQQGNIRENEMLKTFNCGLGMVVIVDKSLSETVLKELQMSGEQAFVVGKVIKRHDQAVVVKNFLSNLQQPTTQLKSKKRVAVLLSGSGTNFQALADYTRAHNSAANICLVISNIATAQGIERAKKLNIPVKVISHKGYKSRKDYDMVVHEELVRSQIEIVCLAGFMRILSDEFAQLWKGKMLNVHPSLLPSFKGTHAYKQALEFGNRITGCTVHFVEPELDSGGIILQEAIPIKLNDTEEDLMERGKLSEHKIYAEALELLAQEKIQLGKNGKVIWNLKTA